MSNRVRDSHWEAGGSLGDILVDLHKEGHISNDQFVSACRFLEDLKNARGNSNGLVPVVEERVQTSIRARLFPAGGAANEAQNRMAGVLDQLRLHEREVLHFLIMKRELSRGTLTDFGRITSNYKTAKTMRAVAVGQVRSLLAAIAEISTHPVPS